MQTIGKYQVEKVLGRGGMGTVYQAHDPVIGRTVALKTMTPGLADTPELKARFLHEAQAAGSLRHHNIVTVYDVGEDRGQPYIAMELIEGDDLEQIIQRREPVSVEWKIDVVRQVCEGLAYAHRNGIVHRDVKPANIRVTPEGEVKIMDFGIAHLQSSALTKGGTALGTAHYMAPEQVEGKTVDHRADVFAVGAIAYELLAYRRPFDADSLPDVMVRIVRDAPDMAGIPRTEYSPGLEQIVARALAKPVAERYQGLDDLRDDLERLVRETAARLLLPPPSEPPARPGVEPAEASNPPVATETAQIESAIAQARADGHLQKALTLSRRLATLSPDAGRRLAAEVEEAIRDKEIEQLSGMALDYAAEGDVEFARTIAARVARLAPTSPKYRELMAYLDEETRRHEAAALLATAQEHIVLGNLDEARAAAEEVLAAQPDHALAREIRDRASSVIERRDRSMPPAAGEDTRPSPPPETASVPDVIGPAPASEPRLDPRKAEAASLTTAALNHFLQNDHARARRVVERALALDPDNRRAHELLDVLGVLG